MEKLNFIRSDPKSGSGLTLPKFAILVSTLFTVTLNQSLTHIVVLRMMPSLFEEKKIKDKVSRLVPVKLSHGKLSAGKMSPGLVYHIALILVLMWGGGGSLNLSTFLKNYFYSQNYTLFIFLLSKGMV